MVKLRICAAIAVLCSVMFFLPASASATFQIVVGSENLGGNTYPTVLLENDIFIITVRTQSGGTAGVESAIKSCILKATSVQVVQDYMDACTFRGPLVSVVARNNLDGSKTATLNYSAAVTEYTIYPSLPYMKIDYLIYNSSSWMNIVEFSATGGEYRVHGSGGWLRSIQSSFYPCAYYNTYETSLSGCTYGPDPLDGGSLNHNGYFVYAYGQTGSNGSGFGRTAPVYPPDPIPTGGLTIIKLFGWGGFEPYAAATGGAYGHGFKPFSNYMFFFTNGVDNGLAYGESLVSPLAVQLASLQATIVNTQTIRVDWVTTTETNNYGFEIQKSQSLFGGYVTIPGSFVPGHGTTVIPHTYSYTDPTSSPGIWYYRLRQIDLDGTFHFSDGVQALQTTGVAAGDPPVEFALQQNYPNPFNPSTTIRYSTAKESGVKLEVFNIVGEKIATLVDQKQAAGLHSVQFDASSIGSGFYIYKLTTGEGSLSKKMMLVR